MKQLLLFATLFLIIGCSGNQEDELPDVIMLLKEEVSDNYLQEKISKSLLNNKPDEAETYKSIARLIDADINYTEIEAKIAEQNDSFTKYWYKLKNISKGFVFGSADNLEEFSGAVASDMLVVGDVRDFSQETANYIQDKDVDYFTYGLSALGIGATVASISTLGGATPAKSGISFLKIARKTGNISDGLFRSVKKLIKESIDFDLFKKKIKNIDVTNISALKDQLKNSFSKSTDLNKLVKLTNNINEIKRNTGSYSNALKVIKYADTTTEVSKLTKLSKKFGRNTEGILKILGKRSIKTINGFMEILYYFAAFMFWTIKALLWGAALMLLRFGFLGAVPSVAILGLSYQFLSFSMIYSWFF